MSDDVHDGLDGPEPSIFGKPTGRKDFLFDSARLLAAAAAAGPFFLAEEQARAAIAASTGQAGDPIATSAVNAAKQYKGVTLTKTNESGLQALDDKNFTGPLWERLTGIKVKVIESPFAQIYSKVIAEHIAGTGGIDVIDGSPVWMPDFAEQDVIDPIDSYIRKYKAQSTLNDYHPLYRALMKYKGQTWGFFDDGDVWNLYYRKDIFANAKLRAAYKAKFKRALGIPRTWDEFTETSQFITDQLAPTVYGGGEGRGLGNPGNQFYFFQQFRARGGQFFNPRTMKAQINNAIGVKTMQSIMLEMKASAPGIEKLELRRLVGELAPGQDGDDLCLAADGPDLRELRPARQGVLVPPEVEDRRQGRLLAHAATQRRARRLVREDGVVGLEEQGGGLPVHPVGDEPVRLAPARAVALHPAGRVPDIALQVGAVQVALALGGPVSEGAQRRGEQRRARPDHDRCG